MRLAFPTPEGALWATVRLRSVPTTARAARLLAECELAALTDAEVAQIREIARPGPAVPDIHPPTTGPAVVVRVGRMARAGRYGGPVHCPGCGFRLAARGDRPHVGYLSSCSGCGGALTVDVNADSVTITYRPR